MVRAFLPAGAWSRVARVARGVRWRAGVVVLAVLCLGSTTGRLCGAEPPDAAEVLRGLRSFFTRTARPDGSFQPGIDPEYRGMSDSAYSDLAAVTYAVTLHRTFGWQLPHAEATREFLLGRQRPSGEFVNVAGTVQPASAEGRTYNTTQALVALHALGVSPRFDPLPVFDEVLRADYKTLPAYSTSFFPLAYRCAGQPIPALADRGIRALMVQDRTGYLNDHIAATFHASHYYHLVGEATPKSQVMLARILAEQQPDGSWLRNMPSRDRHATFDAVFTLLHEGGDRADCRAAIERAARWALSCRNPDGGFGHYPGSTSDADANYFQVGTLVMAGWLAPAQPLPPHPELLSWGHLMPVRRTAPPREVLAVQLDGWIGSVAFSGDGTQLVSGSADATARVWDLATRQERLRVTTAGSVTAVALAPAGDWLATGTLNGEAALWDARTGKRQQTLTGHRGAILATLFLPRRRQLVTAGVEGVVRRWEVDTGRSAGELTGHRSWVNALAYSPTTARLYSGSSDGRILEWPEEGAPPMRTFDATDAEVRSLAVSPDGRWLAAGIRYGRVKVWDLTSGAVQRDFVAHDGDTWGVAITPDSQTLVTGNGDWNRPGVVKYWRLSDGQCVDTFQHTGEVLCLAVSPAEQRLAAGGGDGSLRVWSRP